MWGTDPGNHPQGIPADAAGAAHARAAVRAAADPADHLRLRRQPGRREHAASPGWTGPHPREPRAAGRLPGLAATSRSPPTPPRDERGAGAAGPRRGAGRRARAARLRARHRARRDRRRCRSSWTAPTRTPPPSSRAMPGRSWPAMRPRRGGAAAGARAGVARPGRRRARVRPEPHPSRCAAASGSTRT